MGKPRLTVTQILACSLLGALVYVALCFGCMWAYEAASGCDSPALVCR